MINHTALNEMKAHSHSANSIMMNTSIAAYPSNMSLYSNSKCLGSQTHSTKRVRKTIDI